MALKSKKISVKAKEAAARIDAALQKAEPVADSLLTRLVASPYTVPWLLGAAVVIVAALGWVMW